MLSARSTITVGQSVVFSFRKHFLVFACILVTFVALYASMQYGNGRRDEWYKTNGADITGVETLTTL
jgi:hypothetical protein